MTVFNPAAARRATLLSLILLVVSVQTAFSFCGFYVTKADTTLFNRASKVVLVRDGDRTVVITPVGQFAGALIMFWVLGFLPAFVLCKILAAFDMLRIPKQIELIGLDLAEYEGRYLSEEEVRQAEIEEARAAGLIN